MRQLVRIGLGAALALVLLFAGSAEASTTTIRVSQDGEADWHFGRDPGNVAPWQFTFDEASIGHGSLHAGPIGTVPSSKFIAELFDVDTHLTSMPVEGLESISYDFMIENGLASDANDFYLNVYVNVPGSDTFYDCRYDHVPAASAVGQWHTGTLDAGDATLAVSRGGATCTAALADMPSGSKVTFLSLNLGQSNASDVGLSGYFDNVVIETDTATTVYDFEVPLEDVDDCKRGGWAAYGFSNQGQCVSSLRANPRAGR